MPSSSDAEIVNIHQAKTHLSRLVDRVAKGETIILAKSGTPLAKVVPLDTPSPDQQKRLGFMQGAFSVPDDFDTMGTSEIEAMFLGSDAEAGVGET